MAELRNIFAELANKNLCENCAKIVELIDKEAWKK